MNYVPLYVRSEYCLLQSTSKIIDLVKRAKDFNLKSLAVTDEITMYGAYKFYKQCKANGIKPIIGLKIPYMLNGFESSILLYAMDLQGYRNLMALSSRVKVTQQPIDVLDLQKYNLGVLAITPGADSIFYTFFERGMTQEIINHLEILKSTFAHFFVGVSPINLNNKSFSDAFINFFKSRNISLVALPACYFINPTDIDAYQVLLSIKNGGNLVSLSEDDKNKFFLSPEDVEIIYSNYDDLIANTVKVSELCNLEIPEGKLLLPKYDPNIDANQYLLELALAGLHKRIQRLNIPVNIQQKYYDRLKYELDTIKIMGFADYFLIVWDYVKYSKLNGIYVGPGRGSAGASLVAFCLGITNIDPIKYNLLFERFLNIERITMPDIDIDFPDDKRDQVIKYVGKKYGASRVAHICTFGTFQKKLALNECARVYKLEDTKLKEIVRCIQNAPDKSTLEDAVNSSEPLLKMMDDYDDIAKVVNTAIKIYNLPKNVSTHAAGIIISQYDLVNYTPLDNGLDDIFQTQFEAPDLEALGLLKMDFLGLKNLTNIAKTIDLIKEDNPNFRMPEDENDYATYKMLANGDVMGVFQLESSGMSKVIMEMKTSCLDDIIASLALYRPGPMDMIPTYINRKLGREKVIYPHKDLIPILKDTYGTIVYQEQIMQIACKFAGYSLGKADVLRRAVSKKKKDVLEKERINFVNSSIKQGYSKQVAEEIYDTIVKFANYGFNKAHSVAYAKVAYQTAYLKCHYPAYYISSLMTSCMGSVTDIRNYVREANKKDVKVMPPDIQHSTNEFICYNNYILCPLTLIYGLGEIKTIDLLNERKKKNFTNFTDFIERTCKLLPTSIIENIIYSGALDVFGLTKKAMVSSYKSIIERLEYSNIEGLVPLIFTDEEFGYGYLLEHEKKVLGINIKYNFFDQYKNIYTNQHLIKIDAVRVNQRIRTLGIISSIKEIKTKRNELMAFAMLEDDMSNIELTIFPRVYARIKGISSGSIVIVNGIVQMRNKLQIVVDDLQVI